MPNVTILSWIVENVLRGVKESDIGHVNSMLISCGEAGGEVEGDF
jgi:hypothetical protein